ncbi:ABC transporter substrate-binding protein [Nocardioides sp. YIM 152588]|uniref:ABC transporter substrate-binding protein n=1 Tax=Nocardioides sp. YIM 152588 TaxID=3158259 RepID=UPI0032E45BAD
MGSGASTGNRPRKSRLARGLAAGALGLGLLAPGLALAPAGPAQAADDDVTFTVGVLNEADSFNPFLGIEATSFEMWALMYDYLITYSMDDMAVEPSLATSWETSEDGLTWTFDITDEATWSDGEPLTAEDVAFTYNRVLDGGPERATWGSYLANVTSITAPDATTLVLELEKPSSSLPLLPIPIIPEHVWADVSEKDVKSYKNEPEGGEPVVGSGPFRLVDGSAGGSTIKFEANPDYWKGASHLDEVVFRVYKSEDPLVQALKKGEVDFADGISALQVRALEGEDSIIAQNGDSPGFDEIAFNVGAVDLKTGDPIGDGNPALLDADFRHALGYSIDNDQLIEKVYQGAGLPGSTIVPPAYQYHWAPEGEDAFSYDPEKAGELLDAAGYTEGGDGLRTMPDGSPIGTLRLIARAESPTSLDTMNFFKEWLGDIGIDSEVVSMESSKLTNVILDGDFDAFQWGWYVEPDPTSMLSYMTCDQRGNWSDSWYCSEEYDALYEEQLTETDPDARVEIVKEMQQLVFEDSPYLVTAYNTVGEAFRTDRFACLVQQPNPGGVWLFQYGVYNYLNMQPAADAGDCGGVADATEATSASEESGISTGAVVGIGLGVVVVAALGVVVALRRRGTAGDRE